MDLNQLGPYRVTKKLGEGAMGTVYKGINNDTGDVVALKLLAHQLAHQEGFRIRFEAEIETLRRLKHPNIVGCHGFGEQTGMLFCAMEFVEGTSLADEQKAGRTFTWRQVVEFCIQICAALKHAHDRGIIHRDLKPANLMLTPEGNIKLADFGIARLYGHSGMTMAGTPIGTASYMSPEQAEGETVTERSDLYCLGCTIYTLLAGRPPFIAKSLPRMMQMHLSQKPDSLSFHAQGVPEELDLIVNKLLEKKPEDRIPTAAMLARSLQAVIDAVDLRSHTRITPSKALPSTDQNVTIASPSDDLDDSDSAQDSVETRAYQDSDLYELADETVDSSSSQTMARTTPDSTFKLNDDTQDSLALPATGQSSSSDTVYITAEEATLHEQEIERERERARPRIISSGTVWIAIFIIVAGAITSYTMRPISAKKLTTIIDRCLEKETGESIEKAATYINELDRLYPEHSRLEEYKPVLQEARFLRLERKIKKQAKIRLRNAPGSPIERSYLEAINHEETNPELCLAKLNALIDLYRDRSIQKDKKMLDYLTLAQRQAQRLQEKINEYASEHLVLLNQMIGRAKLLQPTDAQAADRICRAIIVLYDQKAWAAPIVSQAHDILDRTGP